MKIDYGWRQRLQVFRCFQADSHNGYPNKMKDGQDAAEVRNTWGVAWDSAPGVLGPRALAISITESNASIPRPPHYNITILHDFSKSNTPTELHFLELQIIQYSCPSVPLISKWSGPVSSAHRIRCLWRSIRPNSKVTKLHNTLLSGPTQYHNHR